MDSQAYNRYSYVNNNPIMMTDPSGHRPTSGCEDGSGDHCGGNNTAEDPITNNICDKCHEIPPPAATTGGCASCHDTYAPQVVTVDLGSIGDYVDFTADATVAAAGIIANSPAKITWKSVKITFKTALGGQLNTHTFTIIPGVGNSAFRSKARTIGDDKFGPVFLAMGAAGTVLPNYLDNILSGEPQHVLFTELLIDTAGFGVSEMAGDAAFIAGSALTTPVGGFVAEFSVDAAVGNAWDDYWYDDTGRHLQPGFNK